MRSLHKRQNDFLNEDGNTYLFVLTAMVIIFAVFLAALKTTQYETEVSSAENKNSNVYYFALSGLEMGVAQLNQAVDEQKNKLPQGQLLKDKFGSDLESKVVYIIPAISKPYEGAFYDNEKQTYQNTFLKEFYTQVGNKKFEFQVDTQSQQDHLYNVNVTAKYNDKTNAYDMTSIATNQEATTKDGQKVNMILTGQAQMTSASKKEMILERYRWLNATPMRMFTYGALSRQASELTEGSQLVGKVAVQENMDDIVNAQISMESQAWKVEKPLLVSSGGALSIDVSQFYKDDQPINTVILQLSDEPLLLSTSDSAKNEFNGIIYTVGSTEIQGELQFCGTIFSKGVIVFPKDVMGVTADTVTIENDSDMIFKIHFEDMALHRQLLDYFNITAFYKMDRLEVSGTEAMKQLLGNATIDFKGIIVEELGLFQLGSVKMQTTEK